jgi:hypothetical protein
MALGARMRDRSQRESSGLLPLDGRPGVLERRVCRGPASAVRQEADKARNPRRGLVCLPNAAGRRPPQVLSPRLAHVYRTIRPRFYRSSEGWSIQTHNVWVLADSW